MSTLQSEEREIATLWGDTRVYCGVVPYPINSMRVDAGNFSSSGDVQREGYPWTVSGRRGIGRTSLHIGHAFGCPSPGEAGT